MRHILEASLHYLQALNANVKQQNVHMAQLLQEQAHQIRAQQVIVTSNCLLCMPSVLPPDHTAKVPVLACCTCLQLPAFSSCLLACKCVCSFAWLQQAVKPMTAGLQDLLQQMLYFNKHRTPATQGVTSPSVSVTSHAQSEPLLPHTVQRKSGVAAATVCPPSSKQSKAASAEKHSRLPQQGSIAEMHQQRSLRSEQAAPSKEAVAAEKQAVSVVAKPELYSALTAAVSAIVQQAGCAQSQPAADCLRGISLQYHAQGEGAQLEGQASQPEGQASQPEGQDAELDGQSAQLEGQASQPEAQASQLHGQREGHDTQQTCIELQDEDPCSPSKTAVSGASPKIQMSRQAQHAQRSTADATQPASGQQVAHGDEQGGVADGPEQALAWQVQVQIQQAVEVLQAALQPSGKVGAPTGVVASR